MGAVGSCAGGFGGRLTCLVLAALLTGACVNQSVGAGPSPTLASKATPTSTTVQPSAQASPSPTSGGTQLSLATIQRLDARVGFVAAWTGAGPGLARAMDGGVALPKDAVPVARITSLPFIHANRGW